MRTQTPATVDVFCPQCGYNLHGIPELRCPECGFGYSRQAILKVAITNAELRLSGYRRLVLLGVLGLACSSVRSLEHFWHSDAGAVVLAMLSIPFALVWAIAARTPEALLLFPAPGKALLFMLLSPVLLISAVAAPELFSLLATVMLALAVRRLVLLPARLPYEELSLPPRARRRLRVWHAAAWSSLVLATAGVLAILVF